MIRQFHLRHSCKGETIGTQNRSIPLPLSAKAQSSACQLQEELEKLRSTGPLGASAAEEATELKVGGACSRARKGEPTPLVGSTVVGAGDESSRGPSSRASLI